MNGGKSLWEQYVRNLDAQAWEDLGIPMQTILNALADLKDAFYRHATASDPHPKPDKAS